MQGILLGLAEGRLLLTDTWDSKLTKEKDMKVNLSTFKNQNTINITIDYASLSLNKLVKNLENELKKEENKIKDKVKEQL